ncbi:MAG: DNA-processing protein DprA [Treponema sp.]|nr:DNA-processing protein DprA [Treponema sp.]
MVECGLLGLMLARLPELSCRERIALCESVDTEAGLIEKSMSDVEVIINRKLNAFWDINTIRRTAEQDEKRALRRGIRWVSWHDPAYPPLLREMYDPPVLLFYRGRLPDPHRPLAAVVGTRKPSPQAAAQAFGIAKDLGRAGISVVSGLAIGIDAMSHRGNIEGGGSTVAVLGSGVDEVYPSSNRPLAGRILETGGVLFSEYPPGARPRKWTFPARNRIISGLSRGVVIAEAPQKSGALITARFALDQNRDLWVASAGIEIDHGRRAFDRRGTAALAADGAAVLDSASGILEAWNIKAAETENKTGQTASGVHLAANLAGSLGIEL